ncbi:MAG: Abi family protein [Muribaculaceae bacterium]|nr:Abi family protein [Muribaculaceae bacterium]
MKSQYDKKPIPVDEQINLLECKGMEFYDRAFASHVLSIIGYYRFSGYAYPFRNKIDNSGFVDDTSFEKVYSIYEFDRSLKSLLFSYLGRIEIAFRTLIIDKFSVGTETALWYADSDNFTNKVECEEFLANLQYDMEDSREDFIQHFRDTYRDEFPPAWIALQIVSFGALIKLFRNFNNKDLQIQVAKNFGCDSLDRFISWMNTLVYLRNICSHHARLWNRPIKKRPEAYNFGIRNKRWSQQDLAKLYYSVCVIGSLLKGILPSNTFKKKLANLFNVYPFVDSTKSKFLGFPKDWQTEFAW